MKKMVQTIVVMLGFVLASSAAIAAGDASAGQAKSAMCAGCHGADGNSLVPNFPKLAGQGEKYLIKQMQDIQSGARSVPEMTGMLTASSDQDIADLAAYFASKPAQLAGAKEARLEQGERVYRGGNLSTGVPACTGCHSPSGEGNAPAGFPALSGQFAAYTAKQLRAFRTAAHDAEDPAGRSNDGDARIMRDVAANMSDVEIDAVANYIAGLH
ncbi:MAG: c-type cytochrome [Porticoccaceae bacterium]|nr:cytochrome c4 [Pseudomonadales bacterium]MCP5172988.1 cytochrome c4 [Pseudomonadales bacterium]MCP5302461.1 cytochrome c4 [Pseudomonadales bacterium]